MSHKKFNDVFYKLDLSENMKKVFQNFYVISVKIFSKAKLMEVRMKSNEIINEEFLEDLKEDLKNSFKTIKTVKIYLEYTLQDISNEEKIKKSWNNIVSMVKNKSPLCFSIFKSSKFEIDESSINIKLDKTGAFIFKAKSLDKYIIEFLQERFNINFKVNFIDNSKDLKEYIKQRNEELKESILTNNNLENSNIMNNLNSNSLNKNNDKVYDKAKKFRRKAKLKVIEIKDKTKDIKDSIVNEEKIAIRGKIFKLDIIETKKGLWIVRADLTDMIDSVSIKVFTSKDEFKEIYSDILKKGSYVIVKGTVTYDEYMNELIVIPDEICKTEPEIVRQDMASQKRVELHLHTQMSKMDAVSSVKDLIQRAHYWGHKAVAITDHAVVQAFPEAMEISRKLGIKVIYGVEIYLIDDTVNVVQNSKNQSFLDEYVIFDLETTGLNREINKIIEIGAVKIKNCEIVDTFSSFINPNEKLPEKIIELTKITDDMLKDALHEDEVLPKFIEFIGDSILVAHNAKFDMGFLKKWAKSKGINLTNSVIDTVGVSRTLFPDMSKHTLNVIAKKLNISLENHHRAVDDAQATAEIFLKFLEILKEEHKVENLDSINSLARVNIEVKKIRPSHAIVLVKNQVGLRNLYELISKSNLEYFFREPRIPKTEFLKLKEGLIIGTACENGDFYQAILNNLDEEEIENIANFYDYFEIQPLLNNKFLIKNEKVSNVNSEEDLKAINKRIVEYGKKFNKPVVATCDVHFLDKEDACFRKIIMASKGFKDCDDQPPLYFRNTEEMLEEFSYLGEEMAYKVVVENTNLIADMTENVFPIPDGTFPPKIDKSEEILTDLANERAKEIYGEPLPKVVKERLDKELNSIIKNGFAVLYIIAHKVVKNSNENGYIVGSRGSVGSSFAATMAGITEVNPLSPHYICKNCKYSDFDSETVLEYAGNSGWDLPDKDCPSCGARLNKDGHDIPFETFLGFEGDKEPDIDLNFSGEFQAQAHQYTEELFGKGNVFKAGTIGTLADKTAFGFVKKYVDERNILIRSAEINRLVDGCVGIKRTTGQHPGGLMIVPDYVSIYDFSPIQRPADDPNSDIVTTHFDYHSISGRILKLDLLGHDVPTILKMLKDFTNLDPLQVPMDDKDTMSLFTSPEVLGVSKEDIKCDTGSLGLPEFGTPFVIQMLMDTKPNSFSDLVKISGLSHGTDVWFNNAQELIKNGVATLKEVIPTRDDIMVYLILKGIDNKIAFSIMEQVRKGKGLTDEFEKIMIQNNVPNWYIHSCKKIKYMFPKGHAVAYVTNAFRMGYYKIKYPEAFYAAILSVKVEDFDYDKMCFGIEEVEKEIAELSDTGKKATTKEKNKLVVLELVREMYKRGIKFVPMDLYKSHGFKFQVKENGILPPLCSVQGLGENATQSIVKARQEGEFETIEDLVEKTKISKTVVEILKNNKVLKGIPDTNQLTLFG